MTDSWLIYLQDAPQGSDLQAYKKPRMPHQQPAGRQYQMMSRPSINHATAAACRRAAPDDDLGPFFLVAAC